MAMNRFDEAEPLLNKVLELRSELLSDQDPDTLYAKGMLGLIYMWMERHEDAETLFDELRVSVQSIQDVSDQTMLQIVSSLADWCFFQAHYDEAKQLYEKALAIRPENSVLRNSLGTVIAADSTGWFQSTDLLGVILAGTVVTFTTGYTLAGGWTPGPTKTSSGGTD